MGGGSSYEILPSGWRDNMCHLRLVVNSRGRKYNGAPLREQEGRVLVQGMRCCRFLPHDELGMQGTSGFDALENIDHIAR